jgi:hypothetical protein
MRTIGARDTAALLAEITKAKHRFGLPEVMPVVSCHELAETASGYIAGWRLKA